MRNLYMAKDISYWRILGQPAAACRRMLQTRHNNVVLGAVMVAGCAFTLLWADVWNLGRHYDTGKLMSVALVGGPILGLLFFVLSTTISRTLATLLSRRKLPPTHIFAWNSEISRAWIPVAALLWLPYFLFSHPVFSPGSPLLLLWLVPTLPCIGLYAYHSVLPLRVAWGLEWLWSLAILSLSWLLSLSILLAVFSFVAGIPLF